MIQRKQTIFLIMAIVMIAICLLSDIMLIIPQGMGSNDHVGNLFILHGRDNSITMETWPLFLVLVVSIAISIVAIFTFKNRKRQIVLCNLLMSAMLVWYIIALTYFVYVLPTADTRLKLTLSFTLPFVSLLFFALARRGIIADEKLIKAADRIR